MLSNNTQINQTLHKNSEGNELYLKTHTKKYNQYLSHTNEENKTQNTSNLYHKGEPNTFIH